MTTYAHPSSRATATSHSAPNQRRARFSGADWLCFLVPAFVFVELSAIGHMFAPELILLALLPILLSTRQPSAPPVPAVVLVLGALWLFGQFETDLLRGTPFGDYARGWSKIAVTLTNFVALYVLIDGRRRRVVVFAAGMALGLVLKYLFDPSIFAAGDGWKFGFGTSLTLALVLAATHTQVRRSLWTEASILLLASGINLAMGFRSLAGVCFVTATYRVAQRVRALHAQGRRARPAPVRLIFTCAVLVSASLLFSEIYGHAARHGMLGPDAAKKYEAQSKGLGVLVGGRPELLLSVQSIADSPVIGHGSWAGIRSSDEPIWDLSSYLPASAISAASDDVASHSHLFGGWVEAGVLGALFWLWVLVLSLRVLVGLYRVDDPLSTLIAFSAFLLTWDVLFSPFGAERRLFTPFSIIVLLLALRELRARAHASSLAA